jgi:hypothetical protein
MKLKSIALEEKACRKAFKDSKVGDWVVHCHHSQEYEKLDEPASNRIDYILSSKPKNEQALRLRLFRPIKGPALAEYEKIEGPALAEYKKIQGPALAEYEKIEGPAWAEYEKIQGPALAEYEKIQGPAWAEYEKIKGPALAEYEKIKGPAHKIICKTKGCCWDGKNIFKDGRN